MGYIKFSDTCQIARYAALCFIFFVCSTVRTNADKEEAQIVLGTFAVDAGDYDRINTPIRFQCSP
ncbi:MAG: hypothetical protein ACYSWW_06955, partial [Planctomycetota bacterium]